MPRVIADISISLDGYVAGPDQSEEHPLGRGGERLHDWAVATRAFHELHGREGGEENADSDLLRRGFAPLGAHVMGRNMFGPVRGPWDRPWRGWWGEEPPFHAPVFVLTHHPREPLALDDTTFTFVTDGIDSALEQARAAAGDRDVAIAGGASAIRQYLAAGLLDELTLHVVPILLGGGERLLDGAGDPQLAPAEVVGSPAVTHLRYRVVRPAG